MKRLLSITIVRRAHTSMPITSTTTTAITTIAIAITVTLSTTTRAITRFLITNAIGVVGIGGG